MVDILKTYTISTPRHLRYLFFVDSTTSEKDLRKLMSVNLYYWGGRYNPIIPVNDYTISEEWLNLAKFYDPDIIFYSETIDEQLIKSRTAFHPKEYVKLKNERSLNLKGVDAHSLIGPAFEGSLPGYFDRLIHERWRGAINIKAKEFYGLNLGLRYHYASDKNLPINYNRVSLDENSSESINRMIFEEKTLFNSILSQIELSSVYLWSSEQWDTNTFEWIVFDKSDYFENLIYFWNRQLYFSPDFYLNQLISTTTELEELLTDEYYSHFLSFINSNQRCYFSSTSLSNVELKTIRDKVQAKIPTKTILSKRIENFPWKIEKSVNSFANKIKSSNGVLTGNNDLLYYPKSPYPNINNGEYVVDLSLFRQSGRMKRLIRFPYGTELYHLISRTSARVNSKHILSFYPKIQGNSRSTYQPINRNRQI